VAIFAILGPRSHPREPIGVKFRAAKQTHVPLGHAKFLVNRCNQSSLLGENADFWPVKKLKSAVCRFAASYH